MKYYLILFYAKEFDSIQFSFIKYHRNSILYTLIFVFKKGFHSIQFCFIQWNSFQSFTTGFHSLQFNVITYNRNQCNPSLAFHSK